MFKQNCSLCGKEITIAEQKTEPTKGGAFIALWDNIDVCDIGQKKEIRRPSIVYCEKCIPTVRKFLLKKLKKGA